MIDEQTIKEIYQGFKNLVFKTPEMEALAKERLEVCIKCEYRNGKFCGKCGCVLGAKGRSPYSKCPMNLWDR